MHDQGLRTPPQPGRESALQSWIRALDALRVLDNAPELTLPKLLDELVTQHGDQPALLGEGQRFSYRDLATRVNRISQWVAVQQISPGEVVCLLMPNCPDYVATWLGLTRAGCVVALINTNLISDALVHCIQITGSARLIVGSALLPAVAAIADRLAPHTEIWVHGDAAGGNWPRFDPGAMPDQHPLSAPQQPQLGSQDLALLIYTSGTTGAPKAARITHGRILEWSFWFAGMMNVQPADRLYDCLPLYHSTGGVAALGAMLVRGGSVLIRERFSTSRFWDDVAAGECTIFQYIGELCRYLVNSPPHPLERQHRLRLACGNGLQQDVWTAFVQRFEIPRVLEFYAATEGSVSLYNCEGKPGAIGRVPPFLADRFPVRLIQCDPETSMPLRDAAGRCIPCGANEIGEAIGRVLHTSGTPARHFDGYTDSAATRHKLLFDVFVPGDCWFRTGDLMRRDASGYFYFVDRVGDTFRWKGENVATLEVANVLRACPGVTEAVVFGVNLPGHEGRAGMAALTTNEQFDLSMLRRHLMARLPAYAQPLFVRVCASLDVTGTFKLAKSRLVREEFAHSTDPVWFNDRETGQFVACDAGLLQSLADGVRHL